MMVGPMKKKVITSVVVTLIVAAVIFGIIAFIGVSGFTKQIDELKIKSETLQRYVFTRDLTVGTEITASDVQLTEVKALSAPSDSYQRADMVGKILCTNVSAKSIVSEKMFYEGDDNASLTQRLQEFNMISLPSDLEVNDYIDVRLLFPNGEDYSVLVAKKVEKYSNDTIFVKLTEDEILTVGSAIVEAYMLDGAKLYANKYVNPVEQLYDYTTKDYVTSYKNYVATRIAELESIKLDELETQAMSNRTEEEGPLTDEEIASLKTRVNVTAKDLDINEIASAIGLDATKAEEIRTAVLNNDAEVIKTYSNVTESKKVAMERTYPVKSNVLEAIRKNPNIVAEVKANFDTEALLSQRLNMIDTSLTANDSYIQNITAKLQEEIDMQKEERRAYLETLTK